MTLQELKKLAEAASKEDAKGADWLMDNEGWVWASDYWGYQSFIAAANPQTILALIGRLEQALELVELQHVALNNLFDDYKQLADSGDAGHWSLEDIPEGKEAIEALDAYERFVSLETVAKGE